MSTELFLQNEAKIAVEKLYGVIADASQLQIQKTRKEFEGDYTLVAFPLLKISKKNPEATSQEIGQYLVDNCKQIVRFNVIKGFLNLSMSNEYWAETLTNISLTSDYGFLPLGASGRSVMVEFSSPNTNKPLHLGHIRNNLLGFSVSRILEKNGNNVKRVNLVNDRGIHICKSMLAWQKFGNGATPESLGKKGDHFVGDYYVRFDREYKLQIEDLKSKGLSDEEARTKAPLMLEAQEMLRKWEAKDPVIYALWERMNGWVYDGFEKTYKALGISFDKTYHESQTYLLGKATVLEGLDKGVFKRKDDGSIWIDLTNDGLDEKILMRSDGTSVYITQDIGTAIQRFDEHHLDEHIYVVGNEQEYHFQVLKLILAKLGYKWSDNLFHLSYGMVQLPEGKMKSREGTVVDADELVEEMVSTAHDMSAELGKLDGIDSNEAAAISRMVGLGALKYFILKVDPKKNMTFNPRESIDFNGNTGSFIQYTHARICSVLRKAEELGINLPKTISMQGFTALKEIELIKLISEFPTIVELAGKELSPSFVANYAYELTKEYNQFYHDFPILKEEKLDVQALRLSLSKIVGDTIRKSMWLLGIDVPEKM
ncbi:MAG: arginine--tRNA ligase [Bacteroidales bacterium]|nr:arginine--tRNA ligase [Bacteroidales bacterium]